MWALLISVVLLNPPNFHKGLPPINLNKAVLKDEWHYRKLPVGKIFFVGPGRGVLNFATWHYEQVFGDWPNNDLRNELRNYIEGKDGDEFVVEVERRKDCDIISVDGPSGGYRSVWGTSHTKEIFKHAARSRK